ncbi:MAG: hypothetical protein K2O59_09410 [Lachnospiraceae bacterium]|nr:hypothetical protein [Lachnospiraceae bacterium]
MLEQAGSMFDDMEGMLNRIKKKVYGERMDFFRKKNAQLFAEMTGFVEQAANRDQVNVKDPVNVKDQGQIEDQDRVKDKDQVEKRTEAAAQVAKAFADAVEARFAKRGKISGRSQMDINLFMIYFVFPAILLTESDCAVSLADAIRDEWRGRFRDSAQLDYATYEEISGTFKEKFLGLF